MKRVLFCASCGEEIEWETAVSNKCTCGSQKFTTNRWLGAPPSTFPFSLTVDDRKFLRANRIKVD